jgi:hypothetical protein
VAVAAVAVAAVAALESDRLHRKARLVVWLVGVEANAVLN